MTDLDDKLLAAISRIAEIEARYKPTAIPHMHHPDTMLVDIAYLLKQHKKDEEDIKRLKYDLGAAWGLLELNDFVSLPKFGTIEELLEYLDTAGKEL